MSSSILLFHPLSCNRAITIISELILFSNAQLNILCFLIVCYFTEKKPKPENIDIYTLKISSDRRCKVIKLTLADVWKQGCIIRINNFGDKEKAPHSEKDIKNQVCLFTPWNVRVWLTYWRQSIFYDFGKNFFRLPFDLFAAQFRYNCLPFSHIYSSLLFIHLVVRMFTDIVWYESKANALARFTTFRNVVSLRWSATGHSTTAGSWNTKLFL